MGLDDPRLAGLGRRVDGAVAVHDVEAAQHPAAQEGVTAVDASVEQRDSDPVPCEAGQRDLGAAPVRRLEVAADERLRARRGGVDRAHRVDAGAPCARSSSARARGVTSAEKPLNVRVKTCRGGW